MRTQVFDSRNCYNEDTSEKDAFLSRYNSYSSDELSLAKRLKTFTCLSCLGVLQNCYSPEVICQFSNGIEEGAYDTEQFSLGISLPISLGIRIHAIWVHLIKQFPFIEVDPARTNHLGVLKDIWRNLVGERVASKVKKTFVSGQTVPLNIGIRAVYANDEMDCQILEFLDAEKFLLRRKHHRKYAEGVFTKQVVEDTLKEYSDEQFLAAVPNLPPIPLTTVSYSHVQCMHTSIYLAGRYNKYSRDLPQTPWFVEEDRRFESSVQELICAALTRFIRPDGVKFSASGREDVDVRCLGSGRPFFIEMLNPRRVKLDSDDLWSLQEEVNASTPLVKIKDLQMVDKKCTSYLKEGEAEKTKSYCALCFSPDVVSDDALFRVEFISELTLDQMTPLRVLHRRPLITRQRVIHTAKATRLDEHFFKIHMKTQAGTYIKEFIHGDFGRTTPNMGSILGVKCDIIALDVENVESDWPPPVSHKENEKTYYKQKLN